jgi:hypothetical protein
MRASGRYRGRPGAAAQAAMRILECAKHRWHDTHAHAHAHPHVSADICRTAQGPSYASNAKAGPLTSMVSVLLSLLETWFIITISNQGTLFHI